MNVSLISRRKSIIRAGIYTLRKNSTTVIKLSYLKYGHMISLSHGVFGIWDPSGIPRFFRVFSWDRDEPEMFALAKFFIIVVSSKLIQYHKFLRKYVQILHLDTPSYISPNTHLDHEGRNPKLYHIILIGLK
jgi:hypothetical protein